jgi:hypothetical protein
MGFAATLNLINVDGFVAQRNIQRFMRGGAFETAEGRIYPEVDLGYLLSMSADVMPALGRFVDEAPPDVRNELLSEIACRLNQGFNTYHRGSWQSYHFSLATSDRLLDDLADELEQYSVEWDGEWGGMIATGPHGTYECRGYYSYRW